MPFTERLTEALAMAGNNTSVSLPPAQYTFDNANAQFIPAQGGLDMSKFRRAFAHVMAGVIATNGNVAITFQAAATNQGSYANIANGPQVNLTASNTEALLEIRADQLPAGTQFLRVSVLDQVANANLAGALYGGESAYKPGSQYQAGGGNNTTVKVAVASI